MCRHVVGEEASVVAISYDGGILRVLGSGTGIKNLADNIRVSARRESLGKSGGQADAGVGWIEGSYRGDQGSLIAVPIGKLPGAARGAGADVVIGELEISECIAAEALGELDLKGGGSYRGPVGHGHVQYGVVRRSIGSHDSGMDTVFGGKVEPCCTSRNFHIASRCWCILWRRRLLLHGGPRALKAGVRGSGSRSRLPLPFLGWVQVEAQAVFDLTCGDRANQRDSTGLCQGQWAMKR